MDKDTKEMIEILHKNKETTRTKQIIEKQLKEGRKTIKAKKKKRVLIGIALVLVIVLLALMIGKLNNNFIDNCTQGGLSENVCRQAM